MDAAALSNLLLAAQAESSIPRYLQYSAHDTDVGNYWWHLKRTPSSWHTIPFASFMHFHFSVNKACLNERLEQNKDDYDACYHVHLGTNGVPLWQEVSDDRADDGEEIDGYYVMGYREFMSHMIAFSYNQEGYDAKTVIENCN